MIEEATRKLSLDALALWRKYPKHPEILKHLELDHLPADTVIVIGRNRVDVLVPSKYKDSLGKPA